MENDTETVIIEDDGPNSAIAYAPFDKAKEALENKRYRIISLEENARLRMQQRKNYSVSQNGNWTREGVLNLPDKRIVLTRNSPIMINAKEATSAHRNGNEYFLTQEQVEQALQDSVKLSGKDIPTNDFKNNEITNFAFGDVAESYGLFLKEAGIKEMPVYLANVSDKPFARQIWFRGLDGRSELNCYSRSLGSGNEMRGVSEKTSEAGSQNLEGILREVNVVCEKGSFNQKVGLLQKLNKKIDYFVSREMYEEALRFQFERDNLYKELR